MRRKLSWFCRWVTTYSIKKRNEPVGSNNQPAHFTRSQWASLHIAHQNLTFGRIKEFFMRQVEIPNQLVLTVIFLGFSASALGSVNVSTPCFMLASILDWSMVLPNVNSRE
jgi:hypothetical protein